MGTCGTAVLSFSKKHAHCWYRFAGRDEVRRLTSESTTAFKKKDVTPTLIQNSYTSTVRDHGRYEEEGRGWNARERTIIARTRQLLERSFSVKVQVEELEGFLGPEGVDVDFRRILKEAKRDERGRKIFETVNSKDMSFLVAEWSRWDKYKEHHGDKIRQHLHVMDGGKQAWDSLRNS